MKMRILKLMVACAVLLGATAALATDYAIEYGITIRPMVVYLSPDTTSAKLATVDRGREMAVLGRTPGWIHVLATISTGVTGEGKDISGWILDKGLITKTTPLGDQIMFGEAADSEYQASINNGRKGAAGDARRLYYYVYDYFPQSPLAGEALYRSADIRWQLDKADLESRPSAKANPGERLPIEERYMKLVMKKFPGTKWADKAAFRLIDNKLCGEWAAEAKCPLKEADVYLKYAKDYANSPDAAEALYDAAWRYAALIEIYKANGEAKKAPEAEQKAMDLAQQVIAKNAGEDWTTRAQRLIYMLQKKIPAYGNAVD